MYTGLQVAPIMKLLLKLMLVCRNCRVLEAQADQTQSDMQSLVQADLEAQQVHSAFLFVFWFLLFNICFCVVPPTALHITHVDCGPDFQSILAALSITCVSP